MSAEDDLKLLRQVLTARSIPAMPESFENEDTAALFNGLVFIRRSLLAFSRGLFDIEVTGRTVLDAALKTLQANMRHLVWQVEEVAKGDFSQRVDFMGAFSDAFNSMTQQLERSLTELKEREACLLALTANLQSSEERWNLAVQCSRDGIWDVNIDTRTAWYSGNFMQMMHYVPENLPKNLRWETMIHPDDLAEAEPLLEMLRGTCVLKPFSIDCRFQVGHECEGYLWLRIRGMPVRSEGVHRLIAVASDISSQKATEEALTRQAMYDNLTGLPNRYLLNDRLKQAVANAERHTYPFIFVTLDIDFFKEVNDTYGHAAGDAALNGVAHVISKSLRSSDYCARYGGDEFCILLPGTYGDDAFSLAERIRKAVAECPINANGEILRLTTSFGVSSMQPGDAKDRQSLLMEADSALYAAKAAGRNMVHQGSASTVFARQAV
jgi:diguanylate cyclase (GGDEF)-like protein